MNHSFEKLVGGIEDGIIAAIGQLKVGQPDGYLKTVSSYSGELDSEQLRRALSDLVLTMPAMMVAYGSGEDVNDPATPAVLNHPRVYRHDCGFTVICLSDNARSEKARRRGVAGGIGVYRMIGDARRVLGGLKITGIEGADQFILNGEPLRYDGVDYLARLPDLTAYAVHFATWFRYAEFDRTVEGPLVQEVVFTVANQYQKAESNQPGVVLR